MPNMRSTTYTPAKAVDITTSDSDGNSYALVFVGGAGTVKVVDAEGNTSTWVCPAGSYINVQTTKILATGTTATSMVGLI